MEQSDSDKLQPPSLDGVFARKRREKAEREAASQSAPTLGSAPVTAQPQPVPARPAAPATPEPEPLPELPESVEAPVAHEAPATHEPEPTQEPESVEEPEPAQSAPVEAEPVPHPVPTVSETAVLARVIDEPDEPTQKASKTKRAPKQRVPRAPKEPKPKKVRAPKEPKAAKAPKPRRTRRIPALIPTAFAGACAGGVLVALVAVFNRWGGQTDTINAVELFAAFVAAIVTGYVLLAIARLRHRAAISFLGVGMVAVILMFFPSDRWQTVIGGIIVVIATAIGYVAAHAISREATSDR